MGDGKREGQGKGGPRAQSETACTIGQPAFCFAPDPSVK